MQEVFCFTLVAFTFTRHHSVMKYILTAVLFFFAFACFAQSKGSLTLYGFKQNVSGGAPPDRSQGPGQDYKVYKGINYMVYATAPFSFQPLEIWLDGVRYSVSVSVVPTPVLYGDEANIGSPKKTIVPKTGQKVLKLVPIIFKGGKVTYVSAARKLSKTNELVVVYKQAGKIYFSSLRTLTVLEGGAMM